MNIQFTLDQLEVLERIVATGSFAAAARSLHRATSAVSYAVKSLESALDVTLFDRSSRQVRLTPAGELVLDSAREVLGRSRRLEQMGHELAQGWEPHLRIVVDGALPLAPVVSAVSAFCARGAATKVRLMREFLSGVPRRFEREEAHLMLAHSRPVDPALEGDPLPLVEMVLVVRPDHLLHVQPGQVDRQRLCTFVEILVADSGNRDEAPPHPLSQVGSPRQLEVSDFHVKRQALLQGIGFGWLPVHLAADALAKGELVPLRFEEGSRYWLEPALYHRRDVPLGPAARAVRALLLAEMRTEPSQKAEQPLGAAPQKPRRRAELEAPTAAGKQRAATRDH